MEKHVMYRQHIKNDQLGYSKHAGNKPLHLSKEIEMLTQNKTTDVTHD